MQRLRANDVRATIMIFGSARSKDREQHDHALGAERKKLEQAEADSPEHAVATAAIARIQASEWLIEYSEAYAIRNPSRPSWDDPSHVRKSRPPLRPTWHLIDLASD